MKEEWGSIIEARFNAHLASLLNLSTDGFWHELLDQLLQVATLGFPLHDLNHFRADFSDLGRFGVGRLFDLVGLSLGETNGEQSENVAVGRSDINRGFNEGLPFSDDGAEFVGGEVHAVE